MILRVNGYDAIHLLYIQFSHHCALAQPEYCLYHMVNGHIRIVSEDHWVEMLLFTLPPSGCGMSKMSLHCPGV